MIQFNTSNIFLWTSHLEHFLFSKILIVLLPSILVTVYMFVLCLPAQLILLYRSVQYSTVQVGAISSQLSCTKLYNNDLQSSHREDFKYDF